jgi:hypothetical protein
MVGIITGDIMNSRQVEDQQIWLAPLKKVLGVTGSAPRHWEIFRGDSFQVEVAAPEDSFLLALKLKSAIRSIKGFDVRMAVGIGDKTYDAARISESNGPAFVHSGEMFEELKKLKLRLALKTPWPKSDKTLNLMIVLASIVMDGWSANSAEMVSVSLDNQDLSQTELGEKIGKTQSSVSETQARAHYAEIMNLEQYFRHHIIEQIS